MARLGVSVLVLILCLVAAAEAAPKAKNVKCQDRSYPNCFHVKLQCPDQCLRTCTVNCATCQPVCPATPPPPPPKAKKSPPPPSPPPPKNQKSPPPPPYVHTSPPPPPYVHTSPPPVVSSSPPPPVAAYSPPPPVVVSSSPPPPVVAYSPPPPVVVSSSPPPPATPGSSPPPPPTVPLTPSPSPPATPGFSPPPPEVLTPSPPATPLSSPPPPEVLTPSPPATPLSSPPPPEVVPIPSSPPPPVASTPTPPTPPSSEASGGKRVKCKNPSYACYGQEFACPASCSHHCEIDCELCKPVCHCNKPGSICQDPRFIGGDGITFYFHGKKGRDFCLLSDSNLHINGHFIGRRNENMSRDFTWVQSIGILFDTHELYIGAKRTSIWDNSQDHLIVSLDHSPVFLPNEEGSKWQSSSITIRRTLNVNAVEVEVKDNFKIKAVVVPITQEDSRIHKYGVTQENCFAHLDLSFKFFALSGEVDGVLGQTYGSNYVSKAKMGVSMPVLGGEDKFSSSNMFSTDCAVAKFNGGLQKTKLKNFESEDLKCGSGMDGQGVVCKR